jgi:hypothetical protein
MGRTPQQVGRNQRAFIEAFGAHVLPQLRYGGAVV